MPVVETQGEGLKTRPSGVYRHRETGAEVVAQRTSKFGNPQADAFERLGYEYVGPVPDEVSQADPNAAPAYVQGTKSAAELRAELAEAEKREVKTDPLAKAREAKAAKKAAESNQINEGDE